MKRELFRLGATEAAAKIAAGDISAVELVQSCLTRIEQIEPQVQAWVCLDPHYALEEARMADQCLREGRQHRKLSGIPVGVKDIFNTLIFPTQMGSPIRKGYKAGNDARVVAVLRLDGAVILGKTVTAEFGVHWPGPTRNPHNLDHTPGTSSSGSAAAVAAGMVPVALGSQTAGSMIRPASFCGIYGMKPSFGLIPRTGMLKTTDTLDHVGFYARSVDDLALMLDVLRVREADYPIVAAKLHDTSPLDRPWRVAVVKGPYWDRTEDYARVALLSFADFLRADRMHIEELELPSAFERAYAVHAEIYESCLSYYFKEESTQQAELVSSRFMEMVRRGRGIEPARYTAALDQQTALSHVLDEVFDQVDVILTLASNGEAPKGEEPEEHYDTPLIWTLCGAPSMAVPAFIGPNGLPFGAQLVSRKYNDLALLGFAARLERSGLIRPASVAREELRPS